MDRSEVIEGYMKVPTGNICDAMDQLGIPIGVILGLNPISPTQKRAVGYALTIKQMERHQTAEGKGLAKHSKVIDDEISYGDMLVIDVNGRKDVCTGGSILAKRAKLRGASGYVINGCLRDVREIAEMDFPVHLVGSTPVKSSPHLQTIGINIPIEINGVQIIPGDLIVTDDTGIVVIPERYIERVLKIALEINEKENQINKMISDGISFADAVSKTRL